MDCTSDKRDIAIDIARIVAFCCVPGVHFFLNSGFYNTPIIGRRMYVMVLIRTFCMICVPLFMLITGYLQSSKRIINDSKATKTYYRKCIHLIVTYIVCTVVILIFQNVFLDVSVEGWYFFLSLFKYPFYAWYVNMYLGLFILVPFFNALWQSLSNDCKKILITVLAVLTVAPSVFNAYDFHTINTFIKPWTSQSITQIIPDWWKTLYPVTFYFIGAFIKEYNNTKRTKVGRTLLLLGIAVLGSGVYNIWKSYTTLFVWGSWCDWGGWQNTASTILLFLVIIGMKYRMGNKFVKFVRFISERTFSAYLLSWIPDNLFYPMLKERIPEMNMRLEFFPLMVGITIIIALGLAILVDAGIKNVQKLVIARVMRAGH